ncbi:hypothetical protein ACISK3_15085 [Morganella morganii]|nr:hypothetical protein [Morganella morganii]
MKNNLIALSLFAGPVSPSYALDVGDISAFIYSDTDNINKEIKNTTDTGRLINISAERISSPLESGKIIPKESDDELLLSPASLLLPAETTENIRFFYHGPKDNKERYYRIIWTDQALSDVQNSNTERSAIATASAKISTILVVTPREINYDYRYNNGKLTNTGNATLRIVAYGACKDPAKANQKKECKENYYLMPGRDRTFSVVDITKKDSRIALWQAEQFIPVK